MAGKVELQIRDSHDSRGLYGELDGGRNGARGCCLTAPELESRIDDWRRLWEEALAEVSEESGGLTLTFRRDPEVEAVLDHLVQSERGCCSALRFDTVPSPTRLTLRISGPWQETPWAEVVRATAQENSPDDGRGDLRKFVRARYAALARVMKDVEEPAPTAGQSGCCGAAYAAEELEGFEGLKGVSLGSGNVIGAAQLANGESVLDLGSGAGLDVFVAAKRVGASGRVYGLDMTDEMLAVAQANQSAAGLENVEFLKGEIEKIPLPQASVDVVISNCVINLSTSKSEVFAGIFRVLKPGGRLAVSDVVADQPAGEGLPRLNAWAGCIAGALTRNQYREGLETAGFVQVEIKESHEVQPGYASVLVKGRKPV